MTETWLVAALWMLLGLLAALLSIRLRLATPLIELLINMVAAFLSTNLLRSALPGA